MEHINQRQEFEFFPGQKTMIFSLLPSILVRKGNVINVVTEREISEGDLIQDLFHISNKPIKVVRVLETRKAQGDWKNTSYKTPPYWSRIEYIRE